MNLSQWRKKKGFLSTFRALPDPFKPSAAKASTIAGRLREKYIVGQSSGPASSAERHVGVGWLSGSQEKRRLVQVM